MVRKQHDSTPAPQTRAVAYIRVSTDKQRERGLSLEAQQERVRAYAALYGLVIVEIVVEALSAKSLKRPELQRALLMLENGQADALLVVKLDRMVRRVRDLGELIERYFAPGKWDLFSVSEQIDTRSAAGRLVLNVLASVAEWEREVIGERTAAVLQHKRTLGEFTGGKTTPYGYVLGEEGQELVPYPREQMVIDLARSLRSQGLSLRGVAGELRTRGYTNRMWRPWHAQQIATITAGRSS